MGEIDSLSQKEYGIPSLVLMENAGQKAWAILSREMEFPPDRRLRVSFVAGKGNNGGDALVMARAAFLERQVDVSAVLAAPSLKGDAETNRAACAALGIPAVVLEEDPDAVRKQLSHADWIVDGVSGTGITGALRSPLSDLVELINHAAEKGARVAAVDVPSGIGDDFTGDRLTINAEVTLTMGLPKRCLYLPLARPRCGRIRTVPLGFPFALTEAETLQTDIVGPEELSHLLSPLSRTTYKNRRGVVAVFGGAEGTTGAPLLAATACGRSGAGLVRIFADRDVYPVIAAHGLSIMVSPLEADLPELDGYSALVVGPGWGRTPERREMLEQLVATGLPGVADADALNVLAEVQAEGGSMPSFEGRWVLTPHPGECARLAAVSSKEVLSQPFETGSRLAGTSNAVVVLKGHVTYIFEPSGACHIVDGMEPAMATGGSGDVLSGVIGAFLGRGLSPRDAAIAGVLLHAQAGSELFRRAGWFLSEDLLPLLSELLARYQKIG